jgi:hypothetical protein
MHSISGFVMQVSSICREHCGNTQYVMGSSCIDVWGATVTFCYIEHFVVVHTTHKTTHKLHKNPTKRQSTLQINCLDLQRVLH